MDLFCDNNTAIDISHNQVQHDWTKCIKIYCHCIKQNLAKIIHFPFVESEDQLLSNLIKAVSSKKFYNSLHKLGIKDIYSLTWGVVLAQVVKQASYGVFLDLVVI